MVEAATSTLATVWRQTNGAVAQLDADWRERWYVTAGTRVERSAGFTERALVSVLPMLGTAVVFDAEPVSTKLRAAYGKGIRPPRATIGAGTISNATLLANASLEAEEQAGTEVGIDVHAGTRAALHITRFDQRATGLVQPVTVLQSSPQPGGPPRPGDPLQRNLAYQLQNVGAISNRGWELAASVRGGPMALHATFATVDSRVDAVRRSYTGELRVGDRVLDVPARTYGLTAQLAHAGWALQARTTRVEDWIGYDRLAAAEAYASSRRPSGEFVGGALRQFWMRYPGVTRLGATVTRELRGDLSLQLVGENLLDVQTGEPDNATILPGRLVSIGVRARF
jgi:iron complex outermembrane receptor protein